MYEYHQGKEMNAMEGVRYSGRNLRRAACMLLALALLAAGFGGFARPAQATQPGDAAQAAASQAAGMESATGDSNAAEKEGPQAEVNEGAQNESEGEKAPPQEGGVQAQAKARTYTITLPANDEKYTIIPAEGCDPAAVPHCGSFQFTLLLQEGYEEVAPVVKGNGTTLKGAKINGGWVYRIVEIACDIRITVNDGEWTGAQPQPEYVHITFHNGEGASLTDINGDTQLTATYRVEKGSDISFKVKVRNGYDPRTLWVTVDGKEITPDKKGVYHIKNIQSDTRVEASAAQQEGAYMMILNEGEGYTLSNIKGGEYYGNGNYAVKRLGSFSFKVTVKKGYDAGKLIVLANGKALQGKDGVFTVKDVDTDIDFEISVPAKEKQSHTVTIPYGKGYTVTDVRDGASIGEGKYTVPHNGGINFRVRVEKDYEEKDLVVKANGKVITPDESGRYRLKNITTDVEVSIGFVAQKQLAVTFDLGSGTRLSSVAGGMQAGEYAYTVKNGGSLSFEVYVRSEYEDRYLSVKANGAELKQSNGVYTLEDIREDTAVVIRLQESLKRFSLTDKATGVNVSGYSKATPKLRAGELASSTEAYKKLAAQAEDLKVLAAYELALTTAKAEGDVTVTFPVSSAYNGRRVRILRLTSSGKIVKYTPTVKDGKAVITVPALGKFLLAGAEDPSVILPPKTGDGDMRGAIAGWSMIVLAELGIYGIIRRKRRLEEAE